MTSHSFFQSSTSSNRQSPKQHPKIKLTDIVRVVLEMDHIFLKPKRRAELLNFLNYCLKNMSKCESSSETWRYFDQEKEQCQPTFKKIGDVFIYPPDMYQHPMLEEKIPLVKIKRTSIEQHLDTPPIPSAVPIFSRNIKPQRKFDDFIPYIDFQSIKISPFYIKLRLNNLGTTAVKNVKLKMPEIEQVQEEVEEATEEKTNTSEQEETVVLEEPVVVNPEIEERVSKIKESDIWNWMLYIPGTLDLTEGKQKVRFLKPKISNLNKRNRKEQQRYQDLRTIWEKPYLTA